MIGIGRLATKLSAVTCTSVLSALEHLIGPASNISIQRLSSIPVAPGVGNEASPLFGDLCQTMQILRNGRLIAFYRLRTSSSMRTASSWTPPYRGARRRASQEADFADRRIRSEIRSLTSCFPFRSRLQSRHRWSGTCHGSARLLAQQFMAGTTRASQLMPEASTSCRLDRDRQQQIDCAPTCLLPKTDVRNKKYCHKPL